MLKTLNIKRARMIRNLTQLQLAEKVNKSQSVVAMWEIGKSSPRADDLPELADALECTIDELYEDENEVKEAV